MSMGLTPRQADCLRFLTAYIRDHDGVGPSFSEIEEGIDVGSRGEVHRLLTALEERGYIRRLFNRARCIEILDTAPGQAMAAPAIDLDALTVAQLTALSNRVDEALRRRAAGVAA